MDIIALTSSIIVSPKRNSTALLLKIVICYLLMTLYVHASCTPNISNTSSTSTTQLSASSNNDCIKNSGTITISNYAISVGAFLGVSVNNTGTISTLNSFSIYNAGTISEFQNSGNISATTTTSMLGGVRNNGIISSFINLSSISGTSVSENAFGVTNWSSTIGTFINNGTITGTSTNRDVAGLDNPSGTITFLQNNGTISSSTTSSPYGSWGISNTSATLGTLENNGTISGLSSSSLGVGFLNGFFGNYGGTATTITNNGTVSGRSTTNSAYGISNDTGRITTLNNSGTISGISTNSTGYGVYNSSGTINTITNTGAITGTTYGIYNIGGTINSLTNSQGGNSSSSSTTALTYTGTLPSSYYIYITSKTHYGQLALTNPSGNLAFDIANSNLEVTTYTNVLTGISASKISGFSGTSNGAPWKLIEYDTTNHYWNLVVSNSSDNTLLALKTNASLIGNLSNARQSEMSITSDYDCNIFDKHDNCFSLGTRYSSWDNFNDGTGLAIGSFKISNNVRIGTFIDYRVQSSISSNIRSTNETPIIGAFIAFSENIDNTGFNSKISGSYNTNILSITRDNSLSFTEPGNGQVKYEDYQFSLDFSFGLKISDNITTSPFLKILSYNANMEEYDETSIANSVSSPISYNSLDFKSVTYSSGIGIKYRLYRNLEYQFSLGFENRLYRQTSNYAGSSSMDGLSTFNISIDNDRKRIVGFSLLGMDYIFDDDSVFKNRLMLREQDTTRIPSVSFLSGIQKAF